MARASEGDTVRVHYRGTLEGGDEFDSSHEGEPLTVTIGSGELIPGFEAALVGMAAGEDRSVTIPADDAYGAHRPELVHEVERAQIPPEIELEVDGALLARGPDDEPLRLRVAEMTETTVTLDANHPLAGQDLTFELRLVEIL